MTEFAEEPTAATYAAGGFASVRWPVTIQWAAETKSRQAFVTGSVYRFAIEVLSPDAPIIPDLIEYIMLKVVEKDEAWTEHATQEWFDPPAVDAILIGCLRLIHQVKPIGELTEGELDSVALPIFEAVLKGRWNCPVPFILC